MKESLTKQGIASSYTFTRPVPVSVPKVLNTFTAIKTVFNDPQSFKVPYGIKDLSSSEGSIFDCDEKTRYVAVSTFFEVLMTLSYPRHDADKALVLFYFHRLGGFGY
jgi:hypothetical protein